MSNIKVKGVGRAILKHTDGRIETFENCNMVVDSGLDFLIKSVIYSGSNRPDPMSYVAIGSGTGVTTSAMTSLVTETNRGAGTWTYTAGTKTFKISTTFATGAVTALITEGGVFNAASSGTMFDRVLFTTPVQGASDVTYTQEFTFTVE